jgi:hypothetical protein
VIKVHENLTLELTENCTIIPKGCFETTGFNGAVVKYQIWKSNVRVIKAEIEVCKVATRLDPDIKTMLDLIDIPTKCPVKVVRET